jgi:GntR family transcriptional repressor for pyruvate dehydrogenase complex
MWPSLPEARMKNTTGAAAPATEPTATEEKPRAPRVFEAICDQIRWQLSTGALRPGDKLPAERELALQTGSSRTAVREALRSLEMAGVIRLHKGVKGGAFIREGDPTVVTRSFGDMVHLGRISLEDLTESRVILLDAVLRLACERGREQDFDALEQSIDRTEELTRLNRLDERRLQLVNFYRLLAQATRNEVMVIIVDAVTEILLGILQRDGAAPRRETVKAHREIVQCLRRRDADKASQLMRKHFNALHAYLFEARAQGGKAKPRRKMGSPA